MKSLARNSILTGGAVAAFTSTYRFLNGRQVWRWRMTRKLEMQMQEMLDDRPKEQIEMAISVCQVAHLGLYSDWSSVYHDTYHDSDGFYTVIIPSFVEYERQRQIYDLIAERLLAIGNYKKYAHYHVAATTLATAIEDACDKARHKGSPLDELLQSIR